MTNNTFNSEINNIKNDNHYERKFTQKTANMGAQKSPGDRTQVRNSRDLNQSDFGSTHNVPPPKRSVGTRILIIRKI